MLFSSNIALSPWSQLMTSSIRVPFIHSTFASSSSLFFADILALFRGSWSIASSSSQYFDHSSSTAFHVQYAATLFTLTTIALPLRHFEE